MATHPSAPPSFSIRQKWRVGTQVVLVVLTVLCVVAMVNYLSRDYHLRLHVSSQTRVQLAPRTRHFLDTLTNNVKVTLYYDRSDPLYSAVAELLNEYRLASRKITVQTVDYLRDAGAAQKVKTDYKLGAVTDKNLVIFDCEGRVKTVDGKSLTDYAAESVPGERDLTFRTRPVAFKGELLFTSVLLAVTSPKPLKACFLTGHGEHSIDSADELNGYLKLAGVLQQNYLQVETLSLLGTNAVPMDCNLLVIAGPTRPIPDVELERIEQYLAQGGRLFALFKYESLRRETGLEKVLAKWGLDVGANVLKDPDNTLRGTDVIVAKFSRHPAVSPLAEESRLHLILPRAVGRLRSATLPAEAFRVEELAFSGPNAFIEGDVPLRQSYPVMAAVERGAIKGVITERGTTRILVVGDSLFLANRQIDSAGNRDFPGYAVNWLLDRPQLLQGLGPRPITEYRLVMTQRELQLAQWLLLGGMPGSVLLIGGLVWLRRRR